MTRFVVFSLLLLGCCSVQCLPRIIGGEDTDIEQFPSILQVEYNQNNAWSCACGASVLNELFILSAAHCFHPNFIPNYSPDITRIRAGSAARDSGGVIIYIEREFNHPSFLASDQGYDGDINVLRLARPLSFGPTIQQGPIPSHNAVIPDDVSVIIAGWGSMGPAVTRAPVLQHVQVYTVNREECQKRYQSPSQYSQVTANMICAGLLDVGGKSACSGDSGGPLYWNNVVIGVVSWSGQCGHPDYPTVFAAVPAYTNWIVDIIDQESLANVRVADV